MSKLPVTEVASTSESELLNPVPGRRMDLPGFDDEFVDFPDFIIRITDRIWHQRRVAMCLDYYTADCVIHTLAGEIVGAATVVENTHATLASFPDRRLEADNVIWSDDGDDGFYSSHLITSPMTNLGPSEFGPATGKKIRVITIADCACRDNRVYEEWLVRDYAAMALQLGHNPQEVAARQAREDRENGFSLIAHHADLHRAVTEQAGGSVAMPKDPAAEPRQLAEYVLNSVWGHGNISIWKDCYDFRVRATYPGLQDLYGPADVSKLHGDIRGAVPDAKFHVEHVAAIPYLRGAGRDIAIRWSMAGTHSGDGIYGTPSGAPVVIIGVTHWRVINGQIHEEVTIWDDVALRRQIETARLDK